MYSKRVHAYIIGPSLNLLVKAMLILIPERWVAHQQDVQNHTCKKVKDVKS